MTNRKKLLSNLYALISVVILVALDQWTKLLAIDHLKGTSGIQLWKDVFHLYYLENTGAAFGIFKGHQEAFLIVSLLALIVFVYIYERIPFTKHYRLLRIGICVLTAGAIGNMIDRFFRGYVVDFFHFILIDFPIFNVADCFVCIAIAYFVILILFYYKEEDFDRIHLLPWKKKSQTEE